MGAKSRWGEVESISVMWCAVQTEVESWEILNISSCRCMVVARLVVPALHTTCGGAKLSLLWI